MARRKKATIMVTWLDGKRNEYKVDDAETISQRYKQLNFVTHEEIAVAINLHNTKSVEIDSPDIDFNDINHT